MGGVHGDAYTRAHSPANGLAVCRPCHDAIDRYAPVARAAGWLVPHPLDPVMIPTRITTPQGFGWWFLDGEGGYRWCDPQTANFLVNGVGIPMSV